MSDAHIRGAHISRISSIITNSREAIRFWLSLAILNYDAGDLLMIRKQFLFSYGCIHATAINIGKEVKVDVKFETISEAVPSNAAPWVSDKNYHLTKKILTGLYYGYPRYGEPSAYIHSSALIG